MSKLPIQMQLSLAFLALNIVLLILDQPLIMMDGFLDATAKITVLRVVSAVGMLSLVSFLLTSNTPPRNA